MCHFLNYNLVYAATPDMLYQFERFLVVKIAERTQQLSRLRCQGCISGHIFDQLHRCMKVTLKEKIEIFLPKVKDEALSRLNNLFHLYQQYAWVEDEQAFIEGGKTFIATIQADHLLDRRYVNEDTVIECPFDTSWLAEEDDFLVAQIENTMPTILPAIEELDPVAPKKKRKKGKDSNI